MARFQSSVKSTGRFHSTSNMWPESTGKELSTDVQCVLTICSVSLPTGSGASPFHFSRSTGCEMLSHSWLYFAPFCVFVKQYDISCAKGSKFLALENKLECSSFYYWSVGFFTYYGYKSLVTCVINIFPQPVACLFILLMVSFEKHIFYIFWNLINFQVFG